MAHTGSNRLPHRVSQGLTTMSLDGVTAIVPHLGAHLAELTAISGAVINLFSSLLMIF